MSARITGLGLALLGVLFLSPDAALVRLFDGDPWTLIFWRSAGTAVVLGLLSALYFRRQLFGYFNNIGWAGWAMVFVAGVGPILWSLSVFYAGGPMTLAMLALAPLVAAVAGWLFLGERLQLATIVCSLGALVGVVWTVWDGLIQPDISLAGVMLAIALPFNYALIFVFSRKIDRPNSWPILSAGSLVLAVITLFIAPTIALTTAAQWWSIVPMICVVATLSFALMSVATRFVPASDVILVSMLEPVLGIVFLWWVVQELPTANQWVGGSIIFAAVATFVVWQWCTKPQSQGVPARFAARRGGR